MSKADATTARDPYYDVHFESVRLGPVTAKNRFYEVPTATAPTTANLVEVTERRAREARRPEDA